MTKTRWLWLAVVSVPFVGLSVQGASANPAITGGTLPSGGALYSLACSYCHGDKGQGGIRLNAPKLWGTGNVVQGSAYGSPASLSHFVKNYMPLDPVNGINPGSLTTHQAQSLATFILSKEAP